MINHLLVTVLVGDKSRVYAFADGNVSGYVYLNLRPNTQQLLQPLLGDKKKNADNIGSMRRNKTSLKR